MIVMGDAVKEIHFARPFEFTLLRRGSEVAQLALANV
jgi:hypothetical protein